MLPVVFQRVTGPGWIHIHATDWIHCGIALMAGEMIVVGLHNCYQLQAERGSQQAPKLA